MMSKDQVEAASQALLLGSRIPDRAKATSDARRVAIRWLIVPAAGLGSAGLISLYLTGHALPWSLVGLGIGFIIGMVLALHAS